MPTGKRHLLAALVAIGMLAAACGSGSSDGAEGAATTGGGSAGSELQPTSAEFDPNSVIRRSDSGGSQSLDPHQTAGSYTYFLTPVYEPLIYINPEGELEPRLATEWELSEDGLVFEMKLREGVVFHDGTPFDGEAVRLNLERAAEPDKATGPSLATVDRVEVVDSSTVRVHLTAPGGSIAYVLADHAGYMISPTILDGRDLRNEAVGTGPYVLTSVTETLTVYDHFEDYWDPESVHIGRYELHAIADDTARINALASGQIDMATGRSQQIPEIEAAGMEHVSGLSVQQYAIGINSSRAPLNNADIRKAIYYAIDREGMDEALWMGGCPPAQQPFSSGSWADFTPEAEQGQSPYDPDRARELVESSGLSDVSFVLWTYPVTAISRMGEAIQAQLAEVGITVELRLVEGPEIHAEFQAGNADAWLGSNFPSRPDPVAFALRYLSPDGQYNPGGLEVPGGAELLAQAGASVDPEERAEPLREFMNLLAEEGSVYVPVCNNARLLAHTPAVEGANIPMWLNWEPRGLWISE